MTDSAERLWEALRVPNAARVERRVAKALLVERAELTTADGRAVEGGVERLDWRATLRPATVGLAAFTDAIRDYADVVVMAATLRSGAKAARLVEIVHRAVTAPLVLITTQEDAETLSVGLKRRHEREAGRVVVERLVVSPQLRLPIGAAGEDAAAGAFLESLDLARLPARDLWDLHGALAERIETFSAAEATGAWRLPRDKQEAARRREALGRLEAQRREAARLRRAAAAEKRLSVRIELAGGVARAEAQLARTLTLLT